MKQKLLYMGKPIISTYNIYGSLSSIVEHDLNEMIWFYNEFIQIKFNDTNRHYEFEGYDELFDRCPYINHYVLPQDVIIKGYHKNMKEFIMQSIEDNYYVYIVINRYNIPIYDYHKHFYHEIFIYGYDEEGIYFADNLADGTSKRKSMEYNFGGQGKCVVGTNKYCTAKCSFEEFEKAYWNKLSDNHYLMDIHLIRKTDVQDYKINVESIISQLKGYLNSDKGIYIHNNKDEFGIKAVNSVLNSFDYCLENLEDFSNVSDIRTFNLLWEHKYLMKERVKYLNELGYLKNGERFIEMFTQLEGNYKRLLYYNLKILLSGKIKLLSDVGKSLKNNLDEEIRDINQLIEELEGYSTKE